MSALEASLRQRDVVISALSHRLTELETWKKRTMPVLTPLYIWASLGV